MTNTTQAAKPIKLPVRVAMGRDLRIKGANDQDGGWSVVECRDLEHVRQIMAAYPAAYMPCWRRFEAGGDLAGE